MAPVLDLDPITAALAEQERQRTLVFIGLPESNAACPSERVHEDREAITKILDHLEVEAEPTAVFRLGRYDPQRTTPRPLKVVMPTPTHQHVALGGWKHERARLRSQQNMARLFIRPALTKEQLKKEYEERVRKRQQIPAPVAPAVQLPQANAATPANEVEPEQNKFFICFLLYALAEPPYKPGENEWFSNDPLTRYYQKWMAEPPGKPCNVITTNNNNRGAPVPTKDGPQPQKMMKLKKKPKTEVEEKKAGQ